MKTLTIFLPAIFFTVLLLNGCGANNPITSSQNNADTSFVNYVIITPSGGSPDTLYFTDRNLCTGSYSSSQNNTYCLMNDTASNSSSSVTFTGSSTGSPAFTFGYISYYGNGLSAGSITGTVSLYESTGGKIKGTFSGPYTAGSTTYQCSGVFTVYRTN